MHVEIIDFKPEHFDQITLREESSFEKEALLDVAQQTPVYTMMTEKGILCCVGIIPLWPGIAEIWSTDGELINTFPVAFHKAAKHVIDSFWNHYELKRLQATCHVSNEQSWNWLKRLGFDTEGIMRNYGPDCVDYYIMAKVTK